jgi:hypothetical protein
MFSWLTVPLYIMLCGLFIVEKSRWLKRMCIPNYYRSVVKVRADLLYVSTSKSLIVLPTDIFRA